MIHVTDPVAHQYSRPTGSSAWRKSPLAAGLGELLPPIPRALNRVNSPSHLA